MLVDVLPVPGNRRRLALLERHELDPVLGPRGEGDAPTLGGMDSAIDLHRNGSVAGVGVLLALEGFDVPIALAVGVVDNPSFLRLSSPRRPFALPNRHECPPGNVWCRWQYVAICRN